MGAFLGDRKNSIELIDIGIENSNFNNKIDEYDNFEDGIKIGYFAQLKDGELCNIDSSTTKVAGVPLYSTNNVISSGLTYENAYVFQIPCLSYGLVTLKVKAGLEIKKFDKIYVCISEEFLGQASNSSSDGVEVMGYFDKEIKDGIWQVFLK